MPPPCLGECIKKEIEMNMKEEVWKENRLYCQ